MIVHFTDEECKVHSKRPDNLSKEKELVNEGVGVELSSDQLQRPRFQSRCVLPATCYFTPTWTELPKSVASCSWPILHRINSLARLLFGLCTFRSRGNHSIRLGTLWTTHSEGQAYSKLPPTQAPGTQPNLPILPRQKNPANQKREFFLRSTSGK